MQTGIDGFDGCRYQPYHCAYLTIAFKQLSFATEMPHSLGSTFYSTRWRQCPTLLNTPVIARVEYLRALATFGHLQSGRRSLKSPTVYEDAQAQALPARMSIVFEPSSSSFIGRCRWKWQVIWEIAWCRITTVSQTSGRSPPSDQSPATSLR